MLLINTPHRRRAFALAMPLNATEANVQKKLDVRLRQMVERIGAADPAVLPTMTREQMAEVLDMSLHGLRSQGDIDLVSDVELLLLAAAQGGSVK